MTSAKVQELIMPNHALRRSLMLSLLLLVIAPEARSYAANECVVDGVVTSSCTLTANYNGRIVIGGGYLTLDCNGKVISGYGQSGILRQRGILVNSRSHVTIRNCYVTGFLNGIVVQGSQYVTLDNVHAYSNEEDGIEVN